MNGGWGYSQLKTVSMPSVVQVSVSGPPFTVSAWPSLAVMMGPSHDSTRPRIEHGATKHAPFSGGMFGDVGHPQLVRAVTVE